jgi:hypothetical protein
MAVRRFNGSTAYVRLNVGALSAATHGTYAAIFRVVDNTDARTLMAFLSSGNAFLWCPFMVNTDDRMLYHGDSDRFTAAAIPQAVWLLMVVRKATGTATPRFSYYNFNTTTWTHGDATGTTANGTAPTSGFIQTATAGTAGTESFEGDIAVTAGWSNAVHWSADTTGDSQIEAAGLETSLGNWVDETPDGLWPYNQESVATDVTDITGGGADQAATLDTTVVTGDDPPGFLFSLGPAPSLWFTQAALQPR